MGIAAAVAIGSLVVGTAQTVHSVDQQRKASNKARDAQIEARQKQDRLRALKQKRERKIALREAQMERARIQAAGGAAGVGGSSSVQGSAQAGYGTAASNAGFQNQVNSIQQGISGDMQNAANQQAGGQGFDAFLGVAQAGIQAGAQWHANQVEPKV